MTNTIDITAVQKERMLNTIFTIVGASILSPSFLHDFITERRTGARKGGLF